MLILSVAVAIWIAMSWGDGAGAAAVRERFDETSAKQGAGMTSPTASAPTVRASSEDTKRQAAVDVMDMYKGLFGKYPQTEILVHYRDLEITREELRARMKSDEGKPPGMKIVDEGLDAEIARIPVSKADTTKPIVPKPAAMEPGAMAARLMGIAAQISALSEEVASSADRKRPRAYEPFMAF